MSGRLLTLVAAGVLSASCLASSGEVPAAIAQPEPSAVAKKKAVSRKTATKKKAAAPRKAVAAKKAAPQKPADAASCTAEFFSNPANAGAYSTTPTGIKYVMIKEGTGAQPKATDEVTVHYTGRLLDGTVFDSTALHGGQPISFPLNRVIAGWTEGVQLMKEGGEIVLYLPSELAYGRRGTPGGPIPPDADLIFEIKLEKVN